MSRLGRFALINTAGNAFVPLSGAITAPLLASSLGAVGRGEVAAATTPVLLALTVAGLGLPEAATYFVSKNQHTKQTLLSIWMGLAGGSIVGLLGIGLTHDFLAAGDPSLSVTILLCSLILPVCLAGGLLRGLAAGRQLWMLVNLERFITALLRLLAILLLIAADNLNVLSASLTIVSTQAVGGVVYIYLWVAKRRQPVIPLEGPRTNEIFRFAGGAWFGSLAGVLLLRFDQLLMLPLSNSYELGIYAVAVNIAELMLVGSNAIRDVIFSAESSSPKPHRILIASRVAFFGTMIISVLSFGACLIFLPALFGSEFTSATFLFGIMALGFTMGAPGSIAGAGLASRGDPHLRSISLTIAAIANVLLVLALVPYLGALGAAVATAVCAGLGGTLNQVFYSKRYGISGISAFTPKRSDFDLMKGVLKRREGIHEHQL